MDNLYNLLSLYCKFYNKKSTEGFHMLKIIINGTLTIFVISRQKCVCINMILYQSA